MRRALPDAAIHQMCQISAKPVTTAKNALTKPVGAVLRHLDRLVLARLRWLSLCRVRALLRCSNSASRSATWGRTAKFQAGGGDAVDHSSVRPFQGSPVTSRSCSRCADRHDELHDLADDARQNDDGTDRRHHQPRLPSENVVMLHAPGHAHQAQHIERHESEMEADEPAPERTPCPSVRRA